MTAPGRPRARELGSVAFGASAVAGSISPATGQLRKAERSRPGTPIGAVFFLAGALLLPPERVHRRGQLTFS